MVLNLASTYGNCFYRAVVGGLLMLSGGPRGDLSVVSWQLVGSELGGLRRVSCLSPGGLLIVFGWSPPVVSRWGPCGVLAAVVVVWSSW